MARAAEATGGAGATASGRAMAQMAGEEGEVAGGGSGSAPCAQRPCLRLGLVAGLAAAGAGAAAASWPERAEAATLLLRSAPGAPSRPRKGRAVAAIAPFAGPHTGRLSLPQRQVFVIAELEAKGGGRDKHKGTGSFSC